MDDLLQDFPWDSDEQLKGYQGFLQWARQKGVSPEVRPIDLFFILRDHESAVWFSGVIGDQVRGLENQINTLRNDLVGMRRECDRLISRVAELEQKRA